MKVHIRHEEIPSLDINKEEGRACEIPAGLYNRYFSIKKSFQEMLSELWKYYGNGETVYAAPPAPPNTTADQIRSEILTELITSPEPPKKRRGRPPKVKPEPVHEPA